jgi:hypothetical protein
LSRKNSPEKQSVLLKGAASAVPQPHRSNRALAPEVRILDMPASSFSATNLGVELRLGDQLIRYDRAATIQAYAAITTDDAAECGCSFCRNFIANRPSIYPQTFLALLDQLGIDPSKEGEVYECGPAEDGKRVYGGWFFFTGQMIERGERQTDRDGITYWFNSGNSLPRPNGEFGLDLLALNFTTHVPWVLEEPAD